MIKYLTAAWLVNMAFTASAMGPGELTGTWTAVRADVDAMTFDWFKAQMEYRSFLNQKPFESGEWDLRGDSLFLYGPAGTKSFAVSISGDTLKLVGGSSVQNFVKKEEWQELLLYGAYTATSTLKGEDWFGGQTRPYSVRNLGDGDPKTCWAEGVKGYGIGERIYLALQGSPKALNLINGYGKSPDLYAKNGRVKAFKATVLAAFNLPGDVSEVATKYWARRCGPPQRVEVKDIQARQTILLPFDWRSMTQKAKALAAEFDREFSAEIQERRAGCLDRYYQTFVLCLEIAEMYPGTKYEDTCLSELEAE